MILKFFCLLLISFSVTAVFGQVNPCDEFNTLNTKVRDGLISRNDARDIIRVLLPKIKDYFSRNGGNEISDKVWVFPLRGYTSASIGGVNGSGYKPKGYDYFDGNKHGGHPAHDIFIYDRNQNNLDDNTGKPVDILSVSNGVVIACEPDWQADSELRGGKYIYIYDPSYEGIFYYAHNSKIVVKTGDVVNAGDKIAECGRTGLNAYKKRSPTHLHLMFLQVEDGYPKPKNIYNELVNAKTK